MSKQPRCEIYSDGVDMFVSMDGVKIAKRGRPGSPQARTWIALEPGWTVQDTGEGIVVDHQGVRVH